MSNGNADPANPGRFECFRKIPVEMLADGRTRGTQCGQRNVGTFFSSFLQAGRGKPGNERL
jgi:hypothetical protein